MASSAEKYAQQALEAQGYVILASSVPQAIGSIIPFQTLSVDDIEPSDSPAVVISETTLEEFLGQCKMLFGPQYGSIPPYCRRFYRCIAE